MKEGRFMVRKSSRFVVAAWLPALLAIGLVAACAPEVAPSPTDPPVISSFAAVTPAGESPLTTALTWTISDPGRAPLSCDLDLDDDAVYDESIADCTSASLGVATFADLGANTVTLRVSNGLSSATSTTTVTVDAAGADGFDVTLRVDPAFGPGATALIEAAAARWESVMTAGLPSQQVNVTAGSIFAPVPALSTTVDDLFVDVVLDTIDGPGGALALGGGGDFRPDGTTVWGAVAVDSANFATLMDDQRAFLDTVAHEMGHVLLAGPAFSALVDDSSPSDPRFTGAAAHTAYVGLGGGGGWVPMDGTAHWRSTVFGSELMTAGSIVGVPARLSAVTVGALVDLNYPADPARAEPYVLP